MQDATVAALSAGHQPEPLDPAVEIARLQARIDQLRAEALPAALQPVTFRCLGAGAQRARDDSGLVLFTFPVHAGRCVRVAAEYGTARLFARSLIETLGGWDFVRDRVKRRGHRGGVR